MPYLYTFTSLILYCIAPDKYNFTYAVICMVLYVLTCFSTYRRNRQHIEVLSFYTIFSFTFFLANFIFPVFIYPFYPIEIIFNETIDSDLILKGEAMALLGYCCYANGIEVYLNKKQGPTTTIIPQITFKKSLKYVLYILIFINLFFLFRFAGVNYEEYHELSRTTLTINSIMMMMLSMYLAYTLYKNREQKITKIIYNNIVLFVLLSILVFSYTKIGDRGPILQILLALLLAYNLIVKKLSLKQLAIIAICGIALMTSIRYNRNESSFKEGVEYKEAMYGKTLPSYLDATLDLAYSSRAMYLGLEYTEKHGYIYGKSNLINIFSPIPFLPSIVSRLLFNEEVGKISTGNLITNEAGASSGLGTNAVVDVYMNFGIIGVILVFYIFGYLIGYLEWNKNRSVYIICLYCFLGFMSIYSPRSSIFEFTRSVVWIYWLVSIFRIRNKHTINKSI